MVLSLDLTIEFSTLTLIVSVAVVDKVSMTEPNTEDRSILKAFDYHRHVAHFSMNGFTESRNKDKGKIVIKINIILLLFIAWKQR